MYPFKICDYYLYCAFAGEASCTIVHIQIIQMNTVVTTKVYYNVQVTYHVHVLLVCVCSAVVVVYLLPHGVWVHVLAIHVLLHKIVMS